MPRLKTGILISGRGSNMQALLNACADPGFPAEIVLVISNRPDAGGLGLAAHAGVATRIVAHRGRTRETFEADLDRALRDAGVELVCLAGFMRLLTAGFVERWHDRLINVHPSLLPAFPGVDVHERVLAAGARFSGCTVHFVRAGMDDGPIIAQAAVPVGPDDTPETLARRILAAEHQLYPQVLRWIAEGRVATAGGRVTIAGAAIAPATLLNPL